MEIDLRSDSLLDYLTEAYGCQPCSVNLKKLNGEDIAQVRRLLIRPQRTRPRGKKRPIDLTTSEQLSPRSKRRKEDSIFTPPVPYPIQELEMETYDRESKKRTMTSIQIDKI